MCAGLKHAGLVPTQGWPHWARSSRPNSVTLRMPGRGHHPEPQSLVGADQRSAKSSHKGFESLSLHLTQASFCINLPQEKPIKLGVQGLSPQRGTNHRNQIRSHGGTSGATTQGSHPSQTSVSPIWLGCLDKTDSGSLRSPTHSGQHPVETSKNSQLPPQGPEASPHGYPGTSPWSLRTSFFSSSLTVPDSLCPFGHCTPEAHAPRP